MKIYENHPIASLFPIMPEAELLELAADILANGLRVPIVLFRGRILDGRNRYAACFKAGVEPHFIEYTGNNPVRYSLSLNLHRRHLSASQKAAVAADVANLKNGQRADYAATPSGGPAPITQAEAAAMVGTSERGVQRATALRRASPKLFEEVLNGNMTLADATRTIQAAEATPNGGPAPVTQAEAAELRAITSWTAPETGGSTVRTDSHRPIDSNGETDGTDNRRGPCGDGPSRPVTDEERCVRRFKTLVGDLSRQFHKEHVEIRSYIRSYLNTHR